MSEKHDSEREHVSAAEMRDLMVEAGVARVVPETVIMKIDDGAMVLFREAADTLDRAADRLDNLAKHVLPLDVRFSLLDPSAKEPTYAKPGDSGADLCAVSETCVPTLGVTKIPLGFALELPDGYEAQIRPRSSLSAKGIWCALGTIDCGFRGELAAVLYNFSGDDYAVAAGDRIAQLVIVPVPRVKLTCVPYEELTQTARGTGGWGSSGR